MTTEEESVPSCDAEVRPVIENATAEFVPFETLVTINARNDINYIPPIIDNDLSEDDASEVHEVYREQNYADEDEEEHYATMIQNSVASIFPEEIPEVPPETDEPEKDVCSSELYAGTSRKLGVVLLMIFSLSIRFKLSDETLKYIISIIAMLLPFGHNMIKSVYVLK